jgi:hypothetical protein
MPRGYATLPDGRSVSTMSAEYREHVAALPQSERKKPSKKTAGQPTVDVGATSIGGFEPPDSTSFASPKAEAEREPRETPRAVRTKRAILEEDQGDLKELVGQAYASVAAVTGWDGWKLSEDEAGAISRPASRILSRHKNLDKAVRTFVDPLALGAAVIVPTMVRYVGWQHHLAASRIPSARPAGPESSTAPPPTARRPAPAPPVSHDASVSPGPEVVDTGAVGRTLMNLHTLP